MEAILRRLILGFMFFLIGAGFGYWWHMMSGG